MVFPRRFLIVLIIGLLVSSATGSEAPDTQNSSDYSEILISETNSTGSDSKAEGTGNFSENTTENELISKYGIKKPNTNPVYNPEGAEEHNESTLLATNGNITLNESIHEGEEYRIASYDSLGDIIKAQDWKALSEYTCKMKTENPDFFEESSSSLEEKQEKWNDYFTGPPPVSAFPPSCCG
jgi:hypothetical protein